MPPLRDLAGQIFKDVLVNNRAPNRRINNRTTLVMWNCTCLLCGKEFVSRSNNLTSGNTTSCGCTNKESVSKAQIHDLTGLVFGKWTVLKRGPDHISPKGRKKTTWVCKCECGTIKTVLAEKLVNGESQSCGCFKRELASSRYVEDLTGQKFNHLLVIKRVDNVDNGVHVAWLCLCDCGRYTIVRSTQLKKGATQSCGCGKFSINSEKVSKCLEMYGIEFEIEYKFNDLYRYKGHCLRFDFALFENEILKGLIEYQGQQHYEERIDSEFGKVQREITDVMKKDYCIKKNIPLFEIKYDDDIDKRVSEIIDILSLKHVNPVPSELDKFEGQTTIP